MAAAPPAGPIARPFADPAQPARMAPAMPATPGAPLPRGSLLDLSV